MSWKEDRKAKLKAKFPTSAAAKERMEANSARLSEVEDEIDELEAERDTLQEEHNLLEEVIPELEAAENTPEAIAVREHLAAIHNPNQTRLNL